MRKIKHFFVNILSIFIRNKNKRKHFRQVLMQHKIHHLWNYISFYFHKVDKNTVLLVEINSCHGEVAAGYIKYFQDMGYTVDILINPKVLEEKPFCRLNMEKVNVFYFNFFWDRFFINLNKLNQYKHVFLLTTAGYYLQPGERDYDPLLDEYSELRKLKSLYIVEHDIKDIKRFNEEVFVKNKKLITLGHFKKGVFASPILFGDVNITTKNSEVTFICVGTIDIYRKNHQELINAIKQLSIDGYKFKVVVVGWGKLNDIPKEIHHHLDIKGRLDFPNMFSELENADFFLPLLDAENVEHERYITTGVTGSAQLIYAFGKIPVIHPKFASFYNFNENNSIITQSLKDGMKFAIDMKKREYQRMQNKLLQLKSEIIHETAENLKRILN